MAPLIPLAATALKVGGAIGATALASRALSRAGRAPSVSATTPSAAQTAAVAPSVTDESGSTSPVESQEDSSARRVGRAALIATSPQGVLTTAPTGRRKLLAN